MTVAELLHAKHQARRKAKDNPWPARVARTGIAARGAIHLLVGWLAIRIATGASGERADQRGALAAVVRQPMGRVLVLVLAAGFLAYAAWRILEAVLDPDDKGTVQRLGQAGRAALYLALFGTAVKLAVGSQASAASTQRGGGSKGQAVTSDVLGLPGGRYLVLGAAAAIVATGVWNAYRAFSRNFEKQLKEAEMSERERDWTVRAGVVGHAARAAAYFVVGWFLARAALDYDPKEPVGLDQSLKALAAASYGPFLLMAVGAGLIAFGLYQLALARYRDVLDS